MKTISAINGFFGYLSNPQLTDEGDISLDWTGILKLFVIVFLGSTIICAPFFAVLDVDQLPHKLEGIFDEFSGIQIFLLAVILAPIIEELIFRFHLRYPLLILIFISLSISYLILSALGLTQNVLSLAINFFILATCIFLFQFDSIKDSIVVICKRYFGYIFYWTAIIFAFIHSFNYDLSPEQWYYVPILVLPQFLLALLLGYVRLKTDISKAMVLHGMNNLIPVIGLIFLDTM